MLSVDNASNVKENKVEIVLKGHGNILIEKALKFEFSSNNNQAEYVALIASMAFALKMGASRMTA